MSDWPGGITAITLFVENLEASREFYGESFGLPVRFEDENSVVFAFGTTLINLLVVGEARELIGPARVAGRESGSRVQFTLTVDDLDAACRRLEDAGVTLLNGPMDRPWGLRTAAFSDPDGYIWEIAVARAP